MSPTIPAEDVTIMPDGRFTFGRVPPGRYQVRARAQTQADGPALFATFGLVVETRDVANVTMTLQSGALLDGHVSIESRRRNVTAPPLTSLTIRAPLTDGSGFGDALTGRVEGDGTLRRPRAHAGHASRVRRRPARRLDRREGHRSRAGSRWTGRSRYPVSRCTTSA